MSSGELSLKLCAPFPKPYTQFLRSYTLLPTKGRPGESLVCASKASPGLPTVEEDLFNLHFQLQVADNL